MDPPWLTWYTQPNFTNSRPRTAIFAGRGPKNASRINGALSQIVCSVDLPPFFDDA
jgi:hypothetical protein